MSAAELHALTALSPLDGRYAAKVASITTNFIIPVIKSIWISWNSSTFRSGPHTWFGILSGKNLTRQKKDKKLR
jgi:hypothetical protein